MAMSLDGFIASEEGGFDWILGQGDSSMDTKNTFDFEAFRASVDTVVMGSKAYEDCVLSGLDRYDDKKLFVATSRTFKSEDYVEFISSDLCSKVLSIKEKPGKDIWIFGGGGLADAFIKADIIDEYIIGIVPVILGRGRPLFYDNNPRIDLKLKECTISDGITIMKYSKRHI
jgi:dihydrofolate reductase